jgi:signal transduction histidine kinase
VRTKLQRKPAGPGGSPAQTASPETASGSRPSAPGRRSRVRNRLLAGVALCSLAVIGAGTPAVLTGTDNLSESQELVERAELGKRSVALAHALADERDGMVEYVAAGRTSRDGAGVTEEQRARVDRQVTEIRRSAPAKVKSALDKLSRIRQDAQAGQSDARDIYEAYSGTIGALQKVSLDVVRALPSRAQGDSAGPGATGGAHALPDLGRAVEQASAVRGLLRAAFAGDGAQRALMAEAQRANVREQAALEDFGDAAGTQASERFAKTVTGADVTLAERYLARLTDQPYLGPRDRAVNAERADAALSARIDSMRGVHSSFAAEELRRLEQLRDDDVTALELRIAFVAGCLLLAVGISVQTARSMARPLSVLKRGSRRIATDPVGEKAVAYRGRNDEFAEVVEALNQLRDAVVAGHERAGEAEADNAYLVRSKDALTAERDRLRGESATLKEEIDSLSGAVHGTFVNLALRTLGLVERQLGVIEGLEDQESDPGRLSTLFKLDHLATRMRRYSENLLLLAGAEHVTPHHSGPVPLLDVLRAAISEIERYERVELGSLPPHIQVSGFAADDVSHLLAELLDNAATFSPPEAQVQLSGWLLETGEVMLSVEDDGIGVTGRKLSALNARLSTPDDQQPPPLEEPGRQAQGGGPEAGLGMGLYVVARLAARHGLRVQLRERKNGGIAAIVAVPATLLPSRPSPVGTASGDDRRAQAGTSPSLPGSVAEANSNALPVRRVPGAARGDAPGEAEHGPPAREPSGGPPGEAEPQDPLVTAAEEAVRNAGETRQPSAPAPGPAAPPAGEAAPRPQSVPEQHGRAPGDGFAGEASRPGPEHESPEHESPEHVSPEPGPAPTPQGGTEVQQDAAPGGTPASGAEPAGTEAEAPQPKVTDKGLPKRTPRQVAAQTGPVQPRSQSANADELRRRLGGFQRGAQHGRRDAAAETGAERDVTDQSGAQAEGGTAEEART